MSAREAIVSIAAATLLAIALLFAARLIADNVPGVVAEIRSGWDAGNPPSVPTFVNAGPDTLWVSFETDTGRAFTFRAAPDTERMFGNVGAILRIEVSR